MPPKAKAPKTEKSPKTEKTSKGEKSPNTEDKSPKTDKSQGKSKSPATVNTESSTCGDSDDSIYVSPRRVSLNVVLVGDPPGPGEWLFLAVFNDQIVLDGKWHNETVLITEKLSLNLKEPDSQALATEKPLTLLLRTTGGKGAKDPDPLLNTDNRAGASIDLFPLLIGEEEIFIRVPLLDIITGRPTQCVVVVKAAASEPLQETEVTTVPLIITLVSAHCLPVVKEGTFYVGAIGLDQVLEPRAVNLGMSLSSPTAQKTVWAAASKSNQAANTGYSVPDEDKFIPEDLRPKDEENCRSVYWNATKRVRVDSDLLRARLASPLFFELAGVPKAGKTDVRGRYMALVDAGVLLEPGQYGVTVCSKLLFHNENNLPEDYGPLLELPPSSARASARETDLIFDEYGHSAFIVIRFDLSEPLSPRIKIKAMIERIKITPPSVKGLTIDKLDADPPPEDPTIDVTKIRKESCALAVHKELSGFACRGAVSMNQGIKRTAANYLLLRVRSMLKQFPPEACSNIDWQDTVTAQHAACRHSVTASFAPQPPPVRIPAREAAARSRMAGDDNIGNMLMKTNLICSNKNPRALLCMAVRCLEERNDFEARKLILEGLNTRARNRFLLWLLGGQEFDKGGAASEIAAAAFGLAVKGDTSDGTANAIGWAALHTLHHVNDNPYAAFVAAKKMRQSYELPKEWKKFLQRWTDESGEEEVFWIPATVSDHDPMVLAAAFFLCLRCYAFCERILLCVEAGCTTKGSRRRLVSRPCPDIHYLRAASLLLQRQHDKALEITKQGIKSFGPSAILSQMKASCLLCARGWDGECEVALKGAEKAGARPCPALLLKSALGSLHTDPGGALQRAARAHKLAPCGHSALVIGRIYAKMNEINLATRWVAVAVKYEPLLADGWAVLALLAMYEKNLNMARTMLRTAKQLGTFSPDIDEELKKVMEIVQLEQLPDSLVRDLCLCDYC